MSSLLPRAVFVGVWLASVVGALFIAQQYTSATQFFGIADDLEQTVRFASAVQITNIAVVSGTEVADGELILEVRQPDLEADIAVVTDQLAGLTYSEKNNTSSIGAQIVELQAQMRLQHTDIDTNIRNLQSRHNAAAALLRNSTGTAQTSPITLEIASLRRSKQTIRLATNARVESLREQQVVGSRPIDAEKAELAERLAELNQKQQALSVTASLAGRIGSILFKVGDTVPPYQPIVTVHGASPTFIKGYIHESVLNELTKSSRVQVQSTSHPDRGAYAGVVESLGARIVEFPTRLKVNPMAQAWGREVIVRLEGNHELLLGEKVTVQAAQPAGLMNSFRTGFTPTETLSWIEIGK